jgi:UDP-N-acetylmuramate dehydrogenase
MEDIKAKYPELLLDEKLSKYSTFQIGGPADFFYKVSDTSILPSLLKYAKDQGIKTFILGTGSNTLFDDNGFRGLVIKIESKNTEILEGNLVKADSGVSIPRLIKFTVDSGLQGIEHWVGLPGTVGGAVRGNAGCNGLETKDILVSAEIVGQNLEVRSVDKAYFDFDYRFSKLKNNQEIVLNATFQLEKLQSTKEEQKSLMMDLNKNRIAAQPFGSTTGSFFKNPSTDQPAGMLIDQAGLKGKKIGNAQISDKHGNFFLNLGGAKAKEILELARLAKEQVKAKFGLELEQEVQYLPENGL